MSGLVLATYFGSSPSVTFLDVALVAICIVGGGLAVGLGCELLRVEPVNWSEGRGR